MIRNYFLSTRWIDLSLSSKLNEVVSSFNIPVDYLLTSEIIDY